MQNLVVSGRQARPEQQPTDGAADQRCHDKQPQRRQRARSGEERRADGPCRVDRGARDRDADQVDHDQRQSDGQSGQPGRRGVFLGDAQDHGDEQSGRDDFEDQRRAHAEFTQIAGPETVLAQPVGGDIMTSDLACGDHIDHACRSDCANDLTNDISEEITRTHLAGDQNADADRGVQVRTRDVADRVRHGDVRDAEGKTDTDIADIAACKNGAAYSEEDKGEGADRFGKILLHSFLQDPHEENEGNLYKYQFEY